MEKLMIATVVYKFLVDEEDEGKIVSDLMRRSQSLHVYSVNLAEAPYNLQPQYYKTLIAIADRYQAQLEVQQHQQYSEPTQPQEDTQPPPVRAELPQE